MHALLIDGLNLIRRVEAGVPDSPDTVERGKVVEEACVASLRRALRFHGPTHALCAMDDAKPSWRGLIFSDYKKSRRPMPNNLRNILDRIVSRFVVEGVGTVSVKGFEADDVIASITHKIVESNGYATILSTDKSFCQLISSSVSVYDHFSKAYRDETFVRLRYGVEPKRLSDLFALAGDSSLNIPGARGIGLRIGAQLLKEYGNLDSIFSGISGMSERRGRILREDRDAVMLARQLITLRSDVDVGANLRQFRFLANLAQSNEN